MRLAPPLFPMVADIIMGSLRDLSTHTDTHASRCYSRSNVCAVSGVDESRSFWSELRGLESLDRPFGRFEEAGEIDGVVQVEVLKGHIQWVFGLGEVCRSG